MTEQNGTPTGHPGGWSGEGNSFSILDEEASLRDLAVILWKRKTVVLGCVVFCVLMAILVSYGMRPKYKATATIQLNEDRGGGAGLLSGMASMASGDMDELKVKVETESQGQLSARTSCLPCCARA